MFDIISVGDATLDTFVKIKEATVNCQLKKDICQLCLNYADKIPVERLDKTIAGNAANNAVGSSRLGLKSAIYTIVGDDDTGELLSHTMDKEGVSDKYIKIDHRRPSNYSVVINYKSERTQLVHHELRKYELPKLEKTKWMYYTSVGKNHKGLRKDIEKFIRNSTTQLAFNPGTYQLQEGGKNLSSILKITNILFVNKEEAKTIIGHTGSAQIKYLLKQLFKLGPANVVITDGKKGSYAFDGKKYYQMPIYPAKRVEMTGAGDSFATAFIAAIFYGKKIQTALRWGTINSASVIEHIGPQEGLLTLKQIKKRQKTCPTCKVQPLKEA